MPGNTFGTLFRLTTFGESHGPAMGGIIDGCPPGLSFDAEFIQEEIRQRGPSGLAGATRRTEKDIIEWLSGIFEGKTTGMPIAFLIRNVDQEPREYSRSRDIFRPSHADYAAFKKYGIHDHRGGGRFSGRETVCRVAGGGIAKLLLREEGISCLAFTSAIGPVLLGQGSINISQDNIRKSPVRCPNEKTSSEMVEFIEKLRPTGDTAGGVVTCYITGVPAGLGEPVFNKLEAELARAMLSIGGARGFDIGAGFDAAGMKGSEHNDPFYYDRGEISTVTNFSGGIQGGITNGEEIRFRVAFKPVSSIGIPQKTVNREGKEVTFTARGRHDVTLVPRAVAVVEAMAALTLADHLLLQRHNKKIFS